MGCKKKRKLFVLERKFQQEEEDEEEKACNKKKVRRSRIDKRNENARQILGKSEEHLQGSQVFLFRCLLSVITVVIYLNSLRCGFVYDDRKAILENGDVFGDNSRGFLESMKRLLGDDYWGTPMSNAGSHKSYRPLVTLTFKLQAELMSRLLATQELVALSFHLVNLILHLIVVDLVFQCSRLMLARMDFGGLNLNRKWKANERLNGISCIASLLFACHPVHVEAVTSLTGRAELMGALFALSSFKSMLEYTNWEESDKSATRSLTKASIAALCACLSKETGACIIAINLLLLCWFYLKLGPKLKRETLAALIRGAVCMLSLLAAFVALRIHLVSAGPLIPAFSHLDNPLAQDARQFCLRHRRPEHDCSSERVLDRIRGEMAATRLYLPTFAFSILLNPSELSYDWPLTSIGMINSMLELRFILAMVLYTSVALFAFTWLNKLLTSFNANDSTAAQSSLEPLSASNDLSSSEAESETSSIRSVSTIKSSDSGFISSNTERSSPSPSLELLATSARRTKKQASSVACQRDLLGWSLVWLVVPYLPASNLILSVGFLVAERTLYLPSFGFCLLMAILFEQLFLPPARGFGGVPWSRFFPKRLKRRSQKFKASWSAAAAADITAKLLLISPLLILGALKTVSRNEHWLDERALFASNLRQSPAKSLENLASLSSQFESQQLLYRAALKVEPNSPDLHYNLALALQKASTSEGRPGKDPVEYHYELALKLRKNFPLAALNLGAYQHNKLKQLAKALDSFERCAFQMNPRETKTFHQHVQIGIECLISGARLMLFAPTAAAASEPKQTTAAGNCSKVLQWLDVALLRARELSSSLSTFSETKEIGDVSKQLATIHWMRSKCSQQAEEDLKEALEFARRSQVSIWSRIYTDYAELLAGKKHVRVAVNVLREAIEVESGSGKRRAADRKELARLHYKLARLLNSLADREASARALESGLALCQESGAEPESGNISCESEAGALAYDLREFHRSEQLYKKALASQLALTRPRADNNGRCDDRKLASAHANYGAILQVNGRLAEARAQYRRALDCDRANAVAATNLANLN